MAIAMINNCILKLKRVSRFQVDRPVITIDNYKSYLDNGIEGGRLHDKKNFEKVVRGRIRVSADDNPPPHLIINRP